MEITAVRSSRHTVPQEAFIRATWTFPKLPDHFHIGLGERATVSGRGAYQGLGIVATARGIFDDAVLLAVEFVTHRNSRFRDQLQLALGQ